MMPRTPHISKTTIRDLTRLSKNLYNTTLRTSNPTTLALTKSILRSVRITLSYITPSRGNRK